ncbi:hypothetical protein Q5752_003457 [Cryptotrichosporon argae]
MDPSSAPPVSRSTPPPQPNAQAGPSRAPFAFPNINGLSLPPARRSASGGGGDDEDAQAQFQVRMLAQAQALAAAGTLQNGSSGVLPGHQGGAGQPGVPSNLDWGAVASQLRNATDRDALIKQLAALQSHASFSKPGTLAMQNAASPANMTAPSPASATALSPAPGASAPSPAPTATPATASTPLPDPSAHHASQIPPQLRNGLPSLPRPPAQASAATGPAAVMRPMIPNKQQFLQSLTHMYKMANQPPPAEVFNGEVEGAFKLGGVWIDLLDLFISASRAGGLFKFTQASQLAGQQLDQHAFWSSYVASKGVPSPLPEPQLLPRRLGSDLSQPQANTTDPAQFLAVAYIAWISWLENMLMKQKMAMAQRAAQAQAGGAAASPAAGQPGLPVTAGSQAAGATAMRPPSAPSPISQQPQTAPTLEALMQAPTSTPATPAVQASTPAMSAPTPQAMPLAPIATPIVTAPTPVNASSAMPPSTAPFPSAPPAPTPRPHVEVPAASPASVDGGPASAVTPGAPAEKKRKRGRPPTSAKLTGDGTLPTTPTTASTPAMADGLPQTPASTKAAAASTSAAEPRRQRYKVEYKPLHLPQPLMAGWDERRVVASFPKYDARPRVRSYHDLQIVDIESVLMGMRSRMPREVAYALTALSMLSMPLPEDRVGALNIGGLQEVYLELIELVSEAAFGEEGYEAWVEERAKLANGDTRIDHELLERIARDNDYSFDTGPIDLEARGPRERTGRQTDTILAGLNIIRNFSLLPDNRPIMARPELFVLLATIVDPRLARFPGTSAPLPFSVIELARVRRDVVAIFANLGDIFDLRIVPRSLIPSVFNLFASYLSPAYAAARAVEPAYGPQPTLLEKPTPYASLSVDRALEALSRITHHDLNREVIASAVAADDLVSLFAALVRLLPLERREMDAVHTVEDYLGRTELVALALYSLAFLAPLPVRAAMRAVPGATACLARLIFDKATYAPDQQANPFAILVRRLAETMGVLNGTATPGGDARPVGFGAGGVDGKGWRYADEIVHKGWMAARQGEILEAMGWGRRKPARIDGPLFDELDKLWWGA